MAYKAELESIFEQIQEHFDEYKSMSDDWSTLSNIVFDLNDSDIRSEVESIQSGLCDRLLEIDDVVELVESALTIINQHKDSKARQELEDLVNSITDYNCFVEDADSYDKLMEMLN